MTRRLILSYLSVAMIVLVILEVPLAIFYQQRETSRLGADVQRDATVLATYYEEALEQGTAVAPGMARQYAQRTGATVVLVDASRRALVDTTGRAGRDFSTRPEIARALRGFIATGSRHSATLGDDLLYSAVPVASGGTVYGALRLTYDAHDVNELVHRFWLGLGGVAAVVLLVVAGIGWGLARSINRPLRRLQAAAARFATGDLAAAPVDPGAPPEIAELGATMNTMSRRLDQLLREHRAFVADASHQLRTPLTALRLRLENLHGDVAGLKGEAELAAAIDETNRLSALVGDLLRLARAEEAGRPEPVDLAQLARDRVDTWSAVAGDAGVRLRLAAPSEAVIARAVPAGVEQILDNLLDNAVAASPASSTVTVAVSASAHERRLTVADEGPGLGDEQKREALERFRRLDDSHPGSGLGLPIAKALAEASGGSLTLGDVAPHGLSVTVALPAPAAPDR